jgi:hypothetical protein
MVSTVLFEAAVKLSSLLMPHEHTMIRYPITQADLKVQINLERPGWLDRAQARTDAFITAGEYEEKANIWSEVKPVYMRLQCNKCAYCERKLTSDDFGGGIEHDLEHFRPKNSIETWPTDEMISVRGLTYNFETGDAFANGYYWLAYHSLNYCTACKKCNSPLKHIYFPIANDRGACDDEPSTLNEQERPFLIYPLGDLDEDPEDLIGFIGVNAVPKKHNGPRWRRAKVTIEFFELNRREELLRERSEQLVALDNALRVVESDPSEAAKENARNDIAALCHSSSRHASCMRCACKLYIDNTADARELFAAARTYLNRLLRP